MVKSIQKMLNIFILSLSTLFCGASQATTINEFDSLSEEDQSQIVVSIVSANIRKLIEYEEIGLASCMMTLFEDAANKEGKTINVGLGTIANQLHFYREKDPNQYEVEKTVQQVFNYFLKNECIPQVEGKPYPNSKSVDTKQTAPELTS